jgi:hypothetical protein
MNDAMHRPTPAELAIAAVMGFAWAGLGLGLHAAAPAPSIDQRSEAPSQAATDLRASCRIQNHLADGSTNVGSGTLIDVTSDLQRGLILSCAHLFAEGQGRVFVEFPGGRTHGANVIALDREADLSALEVASPPDAAVSVADAVDASTPLTACGFGPRGEFRCIRGSVIGAAETPGQVSLRISGAVRSGDSGGGVFDRQGRLVGVVWGQSGGVTYATSGGPLRQFLQRVTARDRGLAPAPRPAQSSSGVPSAPLLCPNGQCPLVRPEAPLGNGRVVSQPAPGAGASHNAGGCACECRDQLTDFQARLNAIELGKQDRGDFALRGELGSLAHRDELARLDRQNLERHKLLADRLEHLGPLVAAASRGAAPLATTALGISGPYGWGLLAAMSIGGWLIGRRMKARAARRTAPEGKQADASPCASQLAPKEATADADRDFHAAANVETQQPIERDDREARELLRLSQLEGRDPLQDALAGRLALDRLDALAESDADPDRKRLADELRRELRERFNEIAPTKFQLNPEVETRDGL